MISLPDLGRPRDAMMLRAPNTEALYGGLCPEGLRDSKHRWEPGAAGLDRPSEKPTRAYSPGGGVEKPQCHRIKTLWIKRQNNTKNKYQR
ncbi:MAG: hypothetical protein ACO2O0_00275 [Desulfurococcales archaeon]